MGSSVSFCGRGRLPGFKRDFLRQVQHVAQHLVKFQMSLFVAGAALSDFLNDSRGVTCYNFQDKMLAASSKSNLACEAGCGLTFRGRCSTW